MSEPLVDLLRHGDVQGGACFRGERDDPLSALGWEQMRRATASVGTTGWTRIIASPARRCADFARELSAACGLPLSVMDAFRERAFGDWEGRPVDTIPSHELQRFWNDPVGYTPPRAEPFAEFRARVLAAWHELLDGDDESHTLLITHGGVIRVLVAEVLRMSDTGLLLLEVPHACLTRLRIYPPPGRPSLIAHGSLP
ncbi:histidine phosphatase family protein [Allochromatium palmeri]|uniref:Histidine phosphatase family protein n=1 Tax=Allochromatium palmeri TaxID=231048 RepID=A0A6N8EBI2_9GAMM|nr:histidine phosphatase family protein [Allochromatium palmeri]MTW21593.1 histidine phosphatase family protein [Allochromatium palmeri]